MNESLILYFDGASRKNPGESGSGWLIKSKMEHSNYLKKGFEYLGIKTNNQAEYISLLRGLETIKHDFDDNLKNLKLEIRGDSQLIIKQLEGAYKVKSENISELFSQVSKILTLIPYVEYIWIPRSENKEADQLANIAIETKSKNDNYK